MIDDMAVYIANLGKYNEGYLVGAWFTFPIDEEDVQEKIGLNEQYEEYAIHDTDNFPIAIGEYVSIEELQSEILVRKKQSILRPTALHININLETKIFGSFFVFCVAIVQQYQL